MKKFLPVVVAGFTAAALSLPGFANEPSKQQGADAKADTSADVKGGASVGGTGAGASAGAGASSDTQVDVNKNKTDKRKSREEARQRELERGSGSAAGSTSSTPSAPSKTY